MPNLNHGDLLVFAHGFSINYKKIVPQNKIDVCLLAPRMPGKPIREHYLASHGVPAFIDVYQNFSGKALETTLALAKAIGFTKAGVMEVSIKEETELDLFVEQFFLPILMETIQTSFDTLVDEGYSPMPSLMELYASGELGELLLLSARKGIYKVWIDQASPTCRYGIFRSSTRVINKKKLESKIKSVINEVRSGAFLEDLKVEADLDYPNLKSYDEANDNSLLMKTQRQLKKVIKL